MCILDKLNFKIPPDPPSVLAPLALDAISQLLPPGLLLPMGNTQYNVHKKDVSFLSRKGCTFGFIQRYIF